MESRNQSLRQGVAPLLACAVLLAVGLTIGASNLSADTIGYWRMEGTGTVGTVVNEGDGGSVLNGTGDGSADFTNAVPDPYIYDPISGAYFYNSSSLRMGTGSGSITVPDNDLIDNSSFTIECFTRLTQPAGGYGSYIDKSNTSGSSSGWQFDTRKDHYQSRTRWDSAGPQTITGSSVDDANWHHYAVTFDGTNVRFYVDYIEENSFILNGTAAEVAAATVTNSNDLLFGNTGLMGNIDEVRYSTGVLQTNQFLRTGRPPAGMVIGYWRMENDGSNDGDAGSALDGSGSPAFTNDVPHVHIYDPISGTYFNNISSLEMGSGEITVPDHDLIDAPNFTIECFTRLTTNAGGYASYIRRSDSGGRWQFDSIKDSARSRTRWDTTGNGNQTINSATNDFNWHHYAVTFDGTNISLYTDYALQGTKTLAGNVGDATSITNDLIIGSALQGMLDEVRYFNAVLQPDQFLRAQSPQGTLITIR